MTFVKISAALVLLVTIAGCTNSQVTFYRGTSPAITDVALIRSPKVSERKQGQSLSPISSGVQFSAITHVADISFANAPITWIQATSARVIPGTYKVNVVCYFSVYPVQISTSFIEELTVSAGNDYVLECQGDRRKAWVAITQRPSTPDSQYLIAQLQSEDPFEIRLAAITIAERKESDTKVLDQLASVVTMLAVNATGLGIDAASWSCKALAASGNRRYYLALATISRSASESKIVAYCSDAAKTLGSASGEQYLPSK